MKKHNRVLRVLLMLTVVTAIIAVTAFAADVLGGTVHVSSSLNVRSSASTSSGIVANVPNNAKLAVLGKVNSIWYKVAINGKVGYAASQYIVAERIMNVTPGGAKIKTAILNVRSAPSTISSVVAKLKAGAVVQIVGINNGWYKIQTSSYKGYICPTYTEIVPLSTSSVRASEAAVASSSSSNIRQNVLAYAKNFLGVRYTYGGTTPNGFDCSGFTMYVFAKFNVSLPHASAQQFSSFSNKVAKSDLRVGDLVFFASPSNTSSVAHVGIYAGNGNFIHASSPGDVVRIDSLSNSYYLKYYLGARNILG